MRDNEYLDDTESRFDWAASLIAQAEAPAPKLAPVIRIHPERTQVTASRRHDGSFGRDRNVIQVRVGDDGMAVYNLRESVGM